MWVYQALIHLSKVIQMYNGDFVKFKAEHPEYWDIDPDNIDLKFQVLRNQG
jgi:hypothetical protein